MSGRETRKPLETPKRLDELIEYFERGKDFTAELMKENERLRLQLGKLEQEKEDLASRAGSGAAALMAENERLKSRVRALEARFDEIERENLDFANRYVDIQSQNDNLLNLYVASYQLHATLNPDDVISVIQEIILNLIGAEHYFICMLDLKTRAPVITAGEGEGGPIKDRPTPDADPVLQSVIEEGKEYYRSDGGNSPHLACTPLKVEDQVVGAIAIQKLMDQKKGGFTPVDHELLSLLADHAATALMSANLHSRMERKLKTVESFIELLKMS